MHQSLGVGHKLWVSSGYLASQGISIGHKRNPVWEEYYSGGILFGWNIIREESYLGGVLFGQNPVQEESCLEGRMLDCFFYQERLCIARK